MGWLAGLGTALTWVQDSATSPYENLYYSTLLKWFPPTGLVRQSREPVWRVKSGNLGQKVFLNFNTGLSHQCYYVKSYATTCSGSFRFRQRFWHSLVRGRKNVVFKNEAFCYFVLKSHSPRNIVLTVRNCKVKTLRDATTIKLIIFICFLFALKCNTVKEDSLAQWNIHDWQTTYCPHRSTNFLVNFFIACKHIIIAISIIIILIRILFILLQSLLLLLLSLL